MLARPPSIKSGVAHEVALVFVAQRLEELSSLQALDSFRAPTVNVPSLLEEAVEQLASIDDKQSGVPEGSLRPIIDELCDRYAGNAICSAIVAGDRLVIDKIRSAPLDELRRKLPQLKRELSGWSFATETMRLLIEAVPGGKKSLLDRLCRNLVTTLVNLGMSRRHIHESITSFFWDRNDVDESPECLRSLFLIVFPHGHSFEICFVVDEQIDKLSDDAFPMLGIRVHSEVPEKFEAVVSELTAQTSFDEIRFITVDNVTAYDRHSASDVARKRVSLLKNLFRMYNHDTLFSLHSVVASEQCCEDDIILVLPEQRGRRPVRDASERLASKRLSSILRESAFLRGRHYDKFVSVSEFHGLSEDSESSSNKLLNLWISLETICPSVRGKSKVDSVIRGVLPTVSIGYISRRISALANDLRGFKKDEVAAVFAQADDFSRLKRLQLLAILSQPSRQGTRNALYALISENPLLMNRVFETSKSLSSIASINQFIDRHRQNVEWQIRRIYRARNLIVHSGKVPDYIEALVDSAHEYFDQLLGMVGNVSRGPNGFSDFDTAFSFLEWEYSTYRERVNRLDYSIAEQVNALFWWRRKSATRFDVLKQGPKR